jgi:hypothetical protein
MPTTGYMAVYGTSLNQRRRKWKEKEGILNY